MGTSIKILISLLGIILLLSCRINEKKLNQYINNPKHGLTKKITVNNINYKLTYKPSTSFVYNSIKNDKSSLEESLKQTYENHYYFLLQLSSGQNDLMKSLSNNRSQFGELVNQLAFELEKKVNLTTNEKDTIPLAFSHFVRTYGMAPENTVLLCFSKEDLKSDKWLKINIEDLGLNTGTVRFKFKKKDINRIPKIVF